MGGEPCSSKLSRAQLDRGMGWRGLALASGWAATRQGRVCWEPKEAGGRGGLGRGREPSVPGEAQLEGPQGLCGGPVAQCGARLGFAGSGPAPPPPCPSPEDSGQAQGSR